MVYWRPAPLGQHNNVPPEPKGRIVAVERDGIVIDESSDGSQPASRYWIPYELIQTVQINSRGQAIKK